MVASRSDTKRRRRDTSPLDSNPKRTKVHAQRKFAQGVSGLGALLTLTPVKEKSDKSRNNGMNASGNQTNGPSGNVSTENVGDAASSGKRALPARGAKKPSIEDMITFLCYRGTKALPPHLVHLNKAPSPEPASQNQKTTDASRSKLADKTNRDGDKGNNKKALKLAASAPKAVTAAQALKRKYQEQRIKKTTVTTLSSKVKGAPLLRTTRSSAIAIAASRVQPKNAVKKTVSASSLKKKDAASKGESNSKKSVKKPSGSKPPATNKSAVTLSQAGVNRGGLRSGGTLPESVLRSGQKKLASLQKKRKPKHAKPVALSQQSKQPATSLSDFSSEDDQPLVKKHKPLVQVKKLIKKSIANIGRKMKMEPRRSKRGLPSDPCSPRSSSVKRSSEGVSQSQVSSGSIIRFTSPKEDDNKHKSGGKVVNMSGSSKESHGVKNRSSDSQRKDVSSKKSITPRMKKGYVIELVQENTVTNEIPVETRSRRGSRDIRDHCNDDRPTSNQESVETPKRSSTDVTKKGDAAKVVDQPKKMGGVSGSSKSSNSRVSSITKSQIELSFSAVLKSPPDLRIPAAIKRPLTAVGITNPMAIAAAAAVVCKSSSSKLEGKSMAKDKKGDLKEKDTSRKQTKSSSKNSVSKADDKAAGGKVKSKQSSMSDSRILDTKKSDRSKKKTGDTSDEDSKPIISIASTDSKKTKVKGESLDTTKETFTDDDSKSNIRNLRKSGLKSGFSDEDNNVGSTRIAMSVSTLKRSSDEEDNKPLSRARRSTKRLSKKRSSSDEDVVKATTISALRSPASDDHNRSSKSPPAFKLAGTEYECEVDLNLKLKSSHLKKPKAQSSDEETLAKMSNQRMMKPTRPLKSLCKGSSDSEESDSHDVSDSADNHTALKPSTRSASKLKDPEGKAVSRLTRSGKTSYIGEETLSPKVKSSISTSEDEADSVDNKTLSIPKTRSKTVRGDNKKREAHSKSSGDESDEVVQAPRGRLSRGRSFIAGKKNKGDGLRSSSSESASSSMQDVDDEDDDYNSELKSMAKSKKKIKTPGSDSKSALKKSRDKPSNSMSNSQNVRGKFLSDDGSAISKNKREVKGRDDSSSVGEEEPKRSRSPRRSSRKSIRVTTPEIKNDSSVSEASSSESSPSQNRRVLRERKGFFSFAEVDPHSDSDEDVIAAKKASLEMVTHHKTSDPQVPVEAKSTEKVLSSAEESEKYNIKKSKLKSPEPTKSTKKVKVEQIQSKKTLSKKRVKPPSEVQKNLNEELEKTVKSINLSPQSPRTLEKLSDDTMPSTCMNVSIISTPTSSSLPTVSKSPSTTMVKDTPIPSRQRKTVPKISSGESQLKSNKSVSSSTSEPLASCSLPASYHQLSGIKGTLPATVESKKVQVMTAPAISSSYLPSSQAIYSRGSVVSCGMAPITGSASLTTTTTFASRPVVSSVINAPASGPLLSAPVSTVSGSAVPLSSAIPVSIPTAMPLPMSATMPVSMGIPISVSVQGPLTTQMGIPMQNSVNMPLSVPMSGGMTLPLQVGPHASGASSAAPFLLPVQSTLSPMLAPGQTLIKKDSGSLGGMPNPVGNTSSIMVGMNPLVVNNNRTFFLSTGSTMSMATSSQQQMVQGSLMPSLLSLRLPDKPAGQQTIMAGSPLFVPFAFGNPGIIQAQGQGQPQIQTVTGVSTITAMATNIQNPVASNIQNTVVANIQTAMSTSNQSSLVTNIQNTLPGNLQNASSTMSPALTLTQNQGTGLKRHLVLATKNGPASKLILSVGADGSHVLAEASPNAISTSEGQTLMSVMQPMQPMKPPVQMINTAASPSMQTRAPTPTRSSSSVIAPKLTPVTGMQPLTSSVTSSQIVKQSNLASNVSPSPAAQSHHSSVLPGTSCLVSTSGSPFRNQSSTLGGISSSTTVCITNAVPLQSASGTSGPTHTSSIVTGFPVSSHVICSASGTHGSFRSIASSTSCATSAAVSVSSSNPATFNRAIPSVISGPVSNLLKSETQSKAVPVSRPPVMTTSSSLQHQANIYSSAVSTSNRSVVITSSPPIDAHCGKPSPSRTSPAPSKYSPMRMAVTGTSPYKSYDKCEDSKPATSTSMNSNIPTPTVLTSRIPSAPAALAALKSPSSAPASSRAVAKTGSSRKPYSTAASYVATKETDVASCLETTPTKSKVPSLYNPSLSQEASSLVSSPTSSSVIRSLNNPATEKLTITSKSVVLSKTSSSPVLSSFTKGSAPPSSSGISESKHKGTEVQLAPTHRTLSMLSTAFPGNILGKERKREASVKKPNSSLEMSSSYEKHSKQQNIEKSGLDSLAEVALAERSSESSTSVDKRTPQHSLWANPAQILGRETLRVPGLPITTNLGTNLPTKNELAKMKSGAVLADAVDKRIISDSDKGTKGTGNSATSAIEKPSVSGLLTSGKADTPQQKVQKWLDVSSKGDVEHKGSCGLLSNGSNCTCDAMQEDISNLTSLAEVCVSMERINSPVKDQKVLGSNSKATISIQKQDLKEVPKSMPQSSPAKSSHPMNSHQMKVTWQNAFGVKSPLKGNKNLVTAQPKRIGTSNDGKKAPVTGGESPEKLKKVTADEIQHSIVFQRTPPGHPKEQNLRKKDDNGPSSSIEESSQERKSAHRRSLLGRTSDHSHSKLDSSAFSADNESSVYAFEAETDSPPVSQPFRRRSKTLSRSDEEDSTSVGSVSNPIAANVNKDTGFIPIQVETDGSTQLVVSGQMPFEKNGVNSSSPHNEKSNVYYIPICGEEGREDDMRAVAVKLDKEGPNNRVVMSAKIVKKPPTFKHPNDSNEDGLPHKRAKIDAVQATLAQHLNETELDTMTSRQGSSSESKAANNKNKLLQRETSRSSAADSSSEDTSSLTHIPTTSKDTRESRNSMSPASSRNRSPVSDKASPSGSQYKKKGLARLNRQSSVDSDASEKAKSSRRGSKSKSVSSRASPSPSLPSTSSSSSGPSRPSQKSNRSYNGPVPGNVSEAPVFYPTDKEFQDPYAYIEKIRPVAEKYGLCRIVAPNNFKPDCNVEDDIRFMADNQYVHKMLDRWGPNAKEMRAIVKYIAQHNIHLKHAPLVGGMELDLPRLYTTVQNYGGLMEVMDKKRWVKVAETMRIPKSAQDRASKLDEVYCKCLLPYETLKTGERDNLFEMVEVEWEMRKERRDKRLAASAALPGQSVSDAHQDDEDEEEEEEDEEEDECIVKGRSMPLTTFYRIARNTTHMWFKGSSPSAAEVEHEFWRHVKDRNFHICVNAGSVDCSDPPYGFPTRNSPFAKHPWNLKVLSNSSGSVLRSLGSVIGVTVPTLHFGMVFTTCCWYRDPHGLPWIEYLHTGAKKIWYGIPEHGGEKFRSAMQEVAPHYVREKALWLASDTAMVPPNMLTERKVPLCRTVQEPGQFIVVFPRAHTSSVATGYIVSESVSFAPPNWLSTAMESFKEMQKCNEPPLFSLDKLIFSIAEDTRTSLNVLNTILPSAMEILEREITCQQKLKKKGVNTSERIERSKKKSMSKKGKLLKEVEDMEVMECEVCSTNLYLSVVVNTEDDVSYCLVHASQYLEQDKLDPSQCKLMYTYSQNELHEFCQNLLDRIEAKSGKKSNNFSSNNSDSGSSASTSTRN